ncbi:MAG: hypothetical protein JRH20_04455 [Deltaproteobacteria bacterium]|nr:hypothetical protein [Deltaproteobacteria bacterium]
MGKPGQTASVVLVVALWTMGAAAPAQATKTQQAKAQAHALFQRGSVAYKLGRFNEALEHFRGVAGLVNRPSVLFNIAQCHRQMSQDKKAHFSYQLYLSEWERLHPGQPAPFQQEVMSHITKLAERLPYAAASTQPGLIRPTTTRPATAAPKTLATRPMAPEAPHPAFRRLPRPPKASPWYRKWWVWTLVAVTVSTAAVTSVIATSSSETAPMGTLPPGKVVLR